jgi:hypothetical protein
VAHNPTFRLQPTGNRKLYDVHIDLGTSVDDDTIVKLSEELASVQSIKRIHEPYISNGQTILWVVMDSEKRTWREANAYVRGVLLPLVRKVVIPIGAELETVTAGGAPNQKPRYNNRAFRR